MCESCTLADREAHLFVDDDDQSDYCAYELSNGTLCGKDWEDHRREEDEAVGFVARLHAAVSGQSRYNLVLTYGEELGGILADINEA